MSYDYSNNVTILFDVLRQDDPEWPWVVSLVSVALSDTGAESAGCALCAIPKLSDRLCDICAIEESINCAGAENWLTSTYPPHIFDPIHGNASFESAKKGAVINTEGRLRICGRMKFSDYSGIDGEDWDQEFYVSASGFVDG